MSILINGMEMPKTCGKCQIKNAIECNRWKLVRSVVLDRHKDCPLVPVPPHGRLKDYDRVMERYSKWFRNTENREYENMFYMLQNELRGAPTIIPEEEG